MNRILSRAANPARPPPPPPPPPRKRRPRPPSSSNANVPTGKRGDAPATRKTSSSLVLRAAFVAAALGVGWKAFEWKTGSRKDDDEINGFSSVSRDEQEASDAKKVTTNLSRMYLEDLAREGDEMASRVIQPAGEEGEGISSEPFRLDVSREGLVRTLKMMLEMKRKQEKQEIARIRKIPLERRSRGYEESLIGLRSDKKELKDRIKALENSGKGRFL